MNIRKPPLNDIRVRQALLFAADQNAVNDILFDGYYAKSEGPLNNNHPCFWEGAGDMYPHDVKKAGALLDEAGWKLRPASRSARRRASPACRTARRCAIRYNVLHHKEIGEACSSSSASPASTSRSRSCRGRSRSNASATAISS